jgi:3-phosphoshikimate 1-carboxyvinyltransferase
VRREGAAVTIRNVDELVIEDEIVVPADPSSAAFLIAAAVLVSGSRISIHDTATNWTRIGFLNILDRMGGPVVGDFETKPESGEIPAGEPISTIEVASGPLSGTTVRADEVPLAIDELPLVALLGCFAEGETVVTGAEELRLKESDRIATVVDGLNGLGGDLEATEDGFVVRGSGGLRGGTIEAHGDHRLAMLGAVAGLASREGVKVVGMEAAAVSYPAFEDHLRALIER